MEIRLSKESMEMLVEEIIDTVETFENREEQFEAVKVVLESNGIIEIDDEE